MAGSELEVGRAPTVFRLLWLPPGDPAMVGMDMQLLADRGVSGACGCGG